MSNHRRFGERERVIPGYTKEEFENEAPVKKTKRVEHKFDENDRYSNNWNDHRRYGEKSFLDRNNTPSNVICVFNLSFEASEAMLWEEMKNDRLKIVRLITDKENRNPRGFAFCSFPSIVDASNILTKYPSSSGMGVGKSLVLCGQQCFIEYATNSNESRYDKKIDWLCESCQFHNPGKRLKCLRCHQARTESCMDPERLLFEFSQSPSKVCLLKGLGVSANETDLYSIFSEYAPVVKVYIFRDEVSTLSRGYAVIEFDSVESASVVIHTHAYFDVQGIQVMIGYASPECIQHTKNCLSFMPGVATSASSVPMSMPMNMFMYPMDPFYSMYPMNSMYTMNSMNPMFSTNYQQQSQQSQQSQQLGEESNQLPDGRPFPSEFSSQNDKYTLDEQSGYYYDSQSLFYYCKSRNMYLDSKTATYFQFVNGELVPFTPQPPAIIHQENSTEKEKEKSSIKQQEEKTLLISSTPTVFQFQRQNPTAKPKVTIQFKANLDGIQLQQEEEGKEKWEAKFVPDEIDPEEEEEKEKKEKEKEEKEKFPIQEENENEEEKVEKKQPPSLEKICRRKFKDQTQLDKHVESSKYHEYWLKQWYIYHPEYRNRAEERRKKVGSTAFTKPRRPSPYNTQNASETTMVIPGKTQKQMAAEANAARIFQAFQNSQTSQTSSSQPGRQSKPRLLGTNAKNSTMTGNSVNMGIGKLLLEKDGWLQKYGDEKENQTMQTGIKRGGLGYEDPNAKRSMILEGDSFFNAMTKK